MFFGRPGHPPVPNQFCSSSCGFSRRDLGRGHGALQLVSDSVSLVRSRSISCSVFFPSPIGSVFPAIPICAAEFSADLGVHCQAPVSYSSTVAHIRSSPLRLLVGIGRSGLRDSSIVSDFGHCVEHFDAVRGLRCLITESRRLCVVLKPFGVSSI